MHLTGVADNGSITIYKNGIDTGHCFQYQGDGPCQQQLDAAGNRIVIDPVAGSAPLRIGTQDGKSYFQGGIAALRIWNRALTNSEMRDLYQSDQVPPDGLVAQYLLDEGSVLLPARTVALALKAVARIDAVLVDRDRTVICNAREMHPLPCTDRAVTILVVTPDSQVPFGIEHIETDPVGTVRIVDQVVHAKGPLLLSRAARSSAFAQPMYVAFDRVGECQYLREHPDGDCQRACGCNAK